MQTIDPDVRNLTAITPAEAVQLGAENTILFGRLFFPKTFRQPSPHFHYEMAEIWTIQVHAKWLSLFSETELRQVLLRTFTARRISYAISRTIMFVSSSQGHSAFSLRWIRRQVTFNTKWAEAFGLRRGDKWTDEIVEIYHGVDQTPITLLAMGITGQIRGFNIDDYRPDLIIADDVQTEEAVATEEGRVKLKALFHGGLVNSLAAESDAPDAKIVLLQTPMETGDVIDECNRDPSWRGKVFGIFDEGGESRWSAKWSTATLQAQKETAILMGRLSIWMREKECKIIRGEKRAFMVERLQYWDELPLPVCKSYSRLIPPVVTLRPPTIRSVELLAYGTTRYTSWTMRLKRARCQMHYPLHFSSKCSPGTRLVRQLNQSPTSAFWPGTFGRTW